MVHIPLNIIDLEDDGFHPLVEVVVFGQRFTVVLDTGASRTAFDKAMLLEANNQAAFQTGKLSAGLGVTDMASFTIQLHDLHIGPLHVPNFEVAVLDLSTINHVYGKLNLPLILGVLGGDILMRYGAIIDYGKQMLTLKGK